MKKLYSIIQNQLFEVKININFQNVRLIGPIYCNSMGTLANIGKSVLTIRRSLTHSTEGPTAHFKLSNVKITKDIRRDWREITDHRPEVILNNFTTRLGHSVARMLAVLFHYDPQFRGKRAVTFHNQRDYIFFRHHRYFSSDL